MGDILGNTIGTRKFDPAQSGMSLELGLQDEAIDGLPICTAHDNLFAGMIFASARPSSIKLKKRHKLWRAEVDLDQKGQGQGQIFEEVDAAGQVTDDLVAGLGAHYLGFFRPR